MNYALEIDRAVDSEQLASALTLAEQWVVDAPDDDRAWSKLAHVYEMNEDFANASRAVSVALRISPEYPPYLFRKGYVEYRLANYKEAADSFERCVARSETMQDSYYLDAARIAQARCLVLDGSAHLAADAIASAATSSATWLEKRFSKEDVLKSIPGAVKKKRIHPG